MSETPAIENGADAKPGDTGQGRQVCVTGAGGFIGSHVTRMLLERGYRVRATVRDANNADKTKHLRELVPNAQYPLEIVSANLLEKGAFDEAIAGCELVAHVASAVFMTAKDPQKEIVDVAVNGTQNVLESIRKAGTVKRVVLTSSIAAIIDEEKSPDYLYTEDDWNETATVKRSPYPLSKTLAERAAWEYVDGLSEAERFKLVVINPVLVLGPVYAMVHLRSSPTVIRDILGAKYPRLPKFFFGIVDVRDVALAHVRGLEVDGAQGRYILHHKGMWMTEIASVVDSAYPDYKIPTKGIANWLMYIAAMFDKRISWAFLRKQLGRIMQAQNDKVTRELGVSYTPIERTILDTCQAFLENALVTPKPLKKRAQKSKNAAT